MVAVDMAEKACCRGGLVWKSPEVVYPDIWELLDIAIEGRHLADMDDTAVNQREAVIWSVSCLLDDASRVEAGKCQARLRSPRCWWEC